MKKLFTKMLAIVSLMLVGTLGSWAATVETPTLPSLPTGVLDVRALETLDANGWAVYNAYTIHSSTKPDWYKNNNASTTSWTPTAAVTIGAPFTDVEANAATNVLTLRSNRTVAYRIKNASKASIVYACYSAHKVTLDARVVTGGTVAATGVTDDCTESKDANKTVTLTVDLDPSKEYVIYAYSNNDGGNTYFYQLAFKAGEGSTVPALNGAWSKTSDEVLIDAEAPTLPKFGVTATSGSPVKGKDYTVAYSLKAGSTEGILTVDAANGVTAINTAVEGTATVVATVTNLNTTGYTLSTTTFEYTITVLGQPKSTVCTLNDLKVNGVTIEGFDPETKEYNYIVADDVLAVPTVTCTVTDEKSTAVVTAASSIYGQTKVKVTAEDDTKTKTYIITFKYNEIPGTPTYAVAANEAITAGGSIVKDGVTLVYGDAGDTHSWKAGKANDYLPSFTASTEGNGQNPTVGSDKIPTAGTFYKFSATKSGSLKVGVICNNGRDLYVIDGEGNEVYHINPTAKVYKAIDFDVTAGKDYYLYAKSTKLGLYGFYFEEAAPAGAEVNISSVGYATFYDSEHAVEIPADVTAYIFGSDEDYNLGLVSYADALELYDLGSYEGIIPAGEPVVLQGSGLVTLNYATTTAEPVGCGINYLCGSDVETMATMPAEYEGEFTNDDFLFYALSLDTNGENVGFYWMTEAGAPFTTAAHKAYLVLLKAYAGVDMQAKSSFPFNPDNTVTGIRDINTVAKNSAAFNLAGQRVAKNAKGIVIINGTKRINK